MMALPETELLSVAPGRTDSTSARTWPTLETTLSEVCLCLTETLPIAESAGVVVFPANEVLSDSSPTLDGAAVIGTAPAGDTLIGAERRLGQGPVLSAGRSGGVVLSGDLAGDDRWSRFGPTVAGLQVHSALSVPLRARSGAVIGVLVLYSHQSDAFDARALDLAAAVAKIIASALLVGRKVAETLTGVRR